MAEGPPGVRRRGVLRATGLALLAAPLGCAARAPAALDAAGAQRLLDQRARELLAPARGARPADPLSARLARVPLRSWTYRVTSVSTDATGERATVRADLDHRIAGHDPAPVTTARSLALRRGPDRWHVTAERPAPGARPGLWDHGPVDVVHGTRTLVLGTARGEEHRTELTRLAALADRAVEEVGTAWGGDWRRRLLVVVPGSPEAMAALLGEPAAGYRGIAAVTTGRRGPGPADRIVVNPEAYRELSAFGRRIVLTHEATHVATRAHTSARTPMWLSEGYADWAAHRAEPAGPALRRRAPALARAVRAARVPERLPTDADFGFGNDPERLARAYEGAWLACRLVADHWGRPRLNALYRAVDAARPGAGAVEAVLDEVLGVTTAELTARWRARLLRDLG
ncbi:hypothetical protein [Streptomyces sp. NPDC002490]|uniref:hypothetical protein n=1 Tax=Streptomyces sp. NPDC002490 TaxID=3154416 RepID=UPI00331F632C